MICLKEGYVLVIGESQTIDLKASSASGLFYGFQSFRQLCDSGLEAGSKPQNTTIPICTIEDSPVFGYRGMHTLMYQDTFQCRICQNVHRYDRNFIK